MMFDPWNVLTANFGSDPKPYTAFATLLDLALYFVTATKVSLARNKYKVEAPATDGPVGFQRIYRVHMNTLEQMALHLPLLWIAAYAMDDMFAGVLGLIWLFGRALYAWRYYQKAGRRAKGFIVATLANFALFAGALAGTIASF